MPVMIRRRAFGLAAGLQRSTPGAERGGACPSDALLLACRRGSLARRKRRKIVDHVLGCDLCTRKLQAAGRIVADEERLLRDIGAIVEGGKIRAHEERAPSAPRAGWRILGPALGVAVLLAIILVLFPPSGSRSPGGHGIAAAGSHIEEGAESGRPFRLRSAVGGVPDPSRYFADRREFGLGQEGARFEDLEFSLSAPVDPALRWGLDRSLIGRIEFLPPSGSRPGGSDFGLEIRRAFGPGGYFNPAK
jgi:hypothetical protein